MNNDIVLTYISIIIAVYALSPRQIKTKISLSSIFFKGLFVVTIVVLFLGSFDTVLDYFSYITNRLEFFLHYSWSSDIYWLWVWLLQGFSVFGIYKTGKLRSSNISNFRSKMNALFVSKNWEELFELVNENLDTCFKIGFKRNWFERFYLRYLIETTNINIVDYYIEEMGFEEKNNAIRENIFTRAKAGFIKIVNRYIKIPCKKFFRSFFGLFFSRNFVLEDILSIQFVHELASRNEALGYEIIKQYLKRSPNHGKEYFKLFLTAVFIDTNSTTAYQLSELDWEKDCVDNDYIRLLISNHGDLNLFQNIDIAVRKILYDKFNFNLINCSYSPGSDYNDGGDHLILHIRRLLRIMNFIDLDTLFLSNSTMFIAKDLMQVTDWTRYENGFSEYVTGTGYLLGELFDMVEEICEKRQRPDDLERYFGMLNWVLNFDEPSIPFSFKENVAYSSIFFLLKGCSMDKKNTLLREFFKEYPQTQKYFQSALDYKYRKTYHEKNTELFDIIGSSL